MKVFSLESFEGTAVIIFADSDATIGLRVSQMPKSSKVAFFVLMTDDRRQQTNPIA